MVFCIITAINWRIRKVSRLPVAHQTRPWLYSYEILQHFTYRDTQTIWVLATLEMFSHVRNFELETIQVTKKYICILGAVSAKRNVRPLLGFFHGHNHSIVTLHEIPSDFCPQPKLKISEGCSFIRPTETHTIIIIIIIIIIQELVLALCGYSLMKPSLLRSFCTSPSLDPCSKLVLCFVP